MQTTRENMLRNIIKRNVKAAALEEERKRRVVKIVIQEYCEKMIREKREKWQREKVQAAIKEEEKKASMLAAAKAIEMNKKMAKSLREEA